MARQTLGVPDELYEYVLASSLREPEVLGRLRAETAALAQSSKQVLPDEGQFLALLAKLIQAHRTIEVGVFTGYSALWVALALPEDGLIIACDVDKDWTDIAQRYWQEADVAHKIDLRLAPAAKTLEDLLEAGEAEKFDMAFIDADKSHYNSYYEQCLRLVRPGGLILVDNVLWYGRVIDASVQDADTIAIRAINEKIAADERVDVTMLAIGDGLTVAVKR
jgi:caffeoyl-CoA O-methyltransferase